jgi:hypothetical protein
VPFVFAAAGNGLGLYGLVGAALGAVTLWLTGRATAAFDR